MAEERIQDRSTVYHFSAACVNSLAILSVYTTIVFGDFSDVCVLKIKTGLNMGFDNTVCMHTAMSNISCYVIIFS